MKTSIPSIPITGLLADLAEPVRVRMLRVLEGHELSVGELGSVLQMPQSSVSRHLKTLSAGGWLVRRSEGTASLYRLVLDDLDVTLRRLWVVVRDELGRGPELEEDDRRVRAVLAERRTDSQTFFGRVADQWDALRHELFGGRFTGAALAALADPGWVIADLGCGTGNAAALLSPWVKEVIAIDRSEPMLQAARRRVGDLGNVRFVSAELDSLPMTPGSVDLAACVLVLHHIDEPARVLAEMRRVLRASRGGGRALVVDMLEHSRQEYRQTMGHRHLGFSEKQVRGLLTDAGFVDVRCVALPSEPEAKGPGLFAAIGRIGN